MVCIKYFESILLFSLFSFVMNSFRDLVLLAKKILDGVELGDVKIS